VGEYSRFKTPPALGQPFFILGGFLLNKKIIVVDESITLQKVISLILKKEAYSLKFFTKGATALKAIMEEKPDLVIADVSAEDLNGYKLGEKLHENFETKDIPLILTHSSFIEIDDEMYKKSGAQSIISKPFDEKYFIKIVRKFLEKIENPYEDKGDGFFLMEEDEKIEEIGVPDVEEKTDLNDLDDILNIKETKEDENSENKENKTIEEPSIIDDSVNTENLSDEEAERLLREFNLKENNDGTINFDATNPSIEKERIDEVSDIWEEEKGVEGDVPVKRNVDDKMLEDVVREEVRKVLPNIVEKIVKEELDKII
jgi:CheY-like chemotaxis protein